LNRENIIQSYADRIHKLIDVSDIESEINDLLVKLSSIGNKPPTVRVVKNKDLNIDIDEFYKLIINYPMQIWWKLEYIDRYLEAHPEEKFFLDYLDDITFDNLMKEKIDVLESKYYLESDEETGRSYILRKDCFDDGEKDRIF